jgi:hypothetical protein
MVHDSVREELQTKIGTVPVKRKRQRPVENHAADGGRIAADPIPATPSRGQGPRLGRAESTKKSKTLVEFQTKTRRSRTGGFSFRTRSRPQSWPRRTNGYRSSLSPAEQKSKAEYVEKAEHNLKLNTKTADLISQADRRFTKDVSTRDK